MTENKNGKRITKAMCNKGFSGNSSILPRIKFRIGGQESSPQSLTAYSLNRWQQAEEKDNDTMTMNFLLHKDKEKNGNPAHKSKSVAALPYTVPSQPHTCFFCRRSTSPLTTTRFDI